MLTRWLTERTASSIASACPRAAFSTRPAAWAGTFGRTGPSSFRQRQPVPRQDHAPPDGKLTVGHVLHCKFTRNNTHLTLTRQYRRVGKLATKLTEQQKAIDMIRPLEEPLIALNSGTMGFKNTKKGTYEAAYQVTAEMFRRMEERNLLNHGLEITMNQFAEGRRAFVAVLNGKEGTSIRPCVSRVTDVTVVKFGGHRAPGPRRT